VSDLWRHPAGRVGSGWAGEWRSSRITIATPSRRRRTWTTLCQTAQWCRSVWSCSDCARRWCIDPLTQRQQALLRGLDRSAHPYETAGGLAVTRSRTTNRKLDDLVQTRGSPQGCVGVPRRPSRGRPGRSALPCPGAWVRQLVLPGDAMDQGGGPKTPRSR
jgi:hypothetical protein